MANRGMLPKFRPAALTGREASARPAIRRANPTPAPLGPPAAPRRQSSGVRQPQAPEMPDADYETSFPNEPATMAAPNHRIVGRELGGEGRYDDETRAREL